MRKRRSPQQTIDWALPDHRLRAPELFQGQQFYILRTVRRASEKLRTATRAISTTRAAIALRWGQQGFGGQAFRLDQSIRLKRDPSSHPACDPTDQCGVIWLRGRQRPVEIA